MKIATWNVNSLTVRLPQLLEWLQNNAIDIIGIQETKTTNDKFPREELQSLGWHCAFHGQKTYNGVAILSRQPLENIQANNPYFPDEQARLIAANIGSIRLINAYFVNGQAPGTEKFAYKMQWLAALNIWLREELQKAQINQQSLIVLGDFNVAPTDADTFDPEGLRHTIHHTLEERNHFAQMLDIGLVDAFRLFPQAEKSFSWWDYRQLAFQKNKGLRIDHILVSEDLKPRISACHIDRSPRKNKQPSDHTPVVLTLS